MKNKNLINKVIILFAFLLVTSTGFAQITTEKDLAEAIFETIKKNDLEAFKTYCATDERLTKLVNGMGETTPKEKGIKQELKQEKAANFSNECINKFKLLLEELTNNNIVIKDGVFPKMITNETRFEVNSLKSSEIKFKVSFNEVHYKIEIDIFKTKTDLFIYDFQFRKIESGQSNEL